MTDYVVRPATVADAPILARQRRLMFEALGAAGDPVQAEAVETASRDWIARELAAGTFLSWVVEYPDGRGQEGAPDRTIVAGGGLQLRPLMPRPGHLGGHPEALVLSIWTDPAHRRHGLATRIVETMLAWCRQHGIRRVTLHASTEGRRIYERLGFTPTNEMRLEL